MFAPKTDDHSHLAIKPLESTTKVRLNFARDT